jgi:hypothetical protein
MLDAVLLRTLWLTPFNIAIRNIFTGSFSLKGVILVLEGMEKQKYLKESDKHRSPEETNGLYNQSLLWWLNSIIMHGFRHILTPSDLYPLDEEMSSELLNTKFWKTWNGCELKTTSLQVKAVTHL